MIPSPNRRLGALAPPPPFGRRRASLDNFMAVCVSRPRLSARNFARTALLVHFLMMASALYR